MSVEWFTGRKDQRSFEPRFDLERCTDEKEMTEKSGAYLTKLLLKYTDRRILLLLSGGSALGILDEVNADVLGSHVTISMLDERYTSFDDESNFVSLMNKAFFAEAVSQGTQFLDTRLEKDVDGNMESLQAFASRLNDGIRAWREVKGENVIIATQGVGEDGHTAGIMLYPEDPAKFRRLFEGSNDVVDYNAKMKSKFPLRATVSMTFLKECVDESVVYALAKGKEDVLRGVLAAGPDTAKNPNALAALPAAVVRMMKHATLFTNL